MERTLTAVFDIGKTNKKFFLFDPEFREVYRQYERLPLTADEDGHPAEDLEALVAWMRRVLVDALKSGKPIGTLNFSSYGASLVHLDGDGRVLTPLYNYTRPMPAEIEDAFYAAYGPEDVFGRITGTSRSGMLNSGLQLYWLKQARPGVFKRIRQSLHLPQYLSYVFTGRLLSEYTSIGCHTALWDYENQAYHPWVRNEKIDRLLPPIVPADAISTGEVAGHTLRIGPGIHDSSAALLPYLESIRKPFILLSTGTWSIALNAFTDGRLRAGDRDRDCIHYMRIDGRPVKASRLFLGNEFGVQLDALSRHYGVPRDRYREVTFDRNLYRQIRNAFVPAFRWTSLDTRNCPPATRWPHQTYEAAYHQLVYELCLLQEAHIRHIVGDSGIKRLYIDGGFSDNEVFVETLAQRIQPMRIRTTDASLGSALGAALAVSGKGIPKGFLKHHYALKKHKPLILS
ncbi:MULTISPECIES: FGGY-family carbohydrate kinase [Robiginitalea]|uniref:FGGY-family carbohydrate kinase n=1 Tax=Robiginitalea TaxID=252306 RepID=UPI002349146F|nr:MULTISPECIES: FGGY family carbohydrate kinase [unclassified Robiginitalea]MDC6354923.1 FGGY family carbohydrate kinase [Robiginitalea sp. PM2]MDC6375189.1 FGGY family carbohydrate kinase [Robiginitalea sp. SP8]